MSETNEKYELLRKCATSIYLVVDNLKELQNKKRYVNEANIISQIEVLEDLAFKFDKEADTEARLQRDKT